MTDHFMIPPGDHCSFPIGVLTLMDGRTITLEKMCPFFDRSSHGVVYCRFLARNGFPAGSLINTESDHRMALAFYGTEQELEEATPLALLFDKVKECGVNPVPYAQADRDEERTRSEMLDSYVRKFGFEGLHDLRTLIMKVRVEDDRDLQLLEDWLHLDFTKKILVRLVEDLNSVFRRF